MESIPVHFTWSRDLYRSAAVTFTVQYTQPGKGRKRGQSVIEWGQSEKAF